MRDDPIEIVLDPGPWDGPDYADSWPIGGVVTGRVRCRPRDNQKTRNVRVALRWRTEGRGTRDESLVDERILHEGELAAEQAYDWPFELAVPEGPISYDGHLIRILWDVLVRVDIPWERDITVEKPIAVLPDYVDA